MSQLNALHSPATPHSRMCPHRDIQAFHFMVNWIMVSSRFISKIFCNTSMLILMIINDIPIKCLVSLRMLETFLWTSTFFSPLSNWSCLWHEMWESQMCLVVLDSCKLMGRRLRALHKYIPGAFIECKAYNPGRINTVQLKHENKS